MRIDDLLNGKGRDVATVPPDATIRQVLAELDRHKIGALVVCGADRHPEGIISERDIVRHLHLHDAVVLDSQVADLMVRDVLTIGPQADVESLMEVMTTHRIRHVPVLEDGRLVGIVSIGDVVKQRLDALADDNRVLHDYINAR